MTVVQATIKGDILTLINSAKSSAMSEDNYADGLATIIYDAILSQTVTLTTLVALDSLSAPVVLTTGDSTVS